MKILSIEYERRRKAPWRAITRQPWRSALLLVGILVAAVSGAVAVSRLQPPRTSGERVPVPSPEAIDLGKLPPRTRVEKVIPIRNATDSPLEVATIRTTCPCLTIHINEPIIPPSGTVSAHAVLDLRDEPNFTGDLGIEVTATTEGGKVDLLACVKVKVVSAEPAGESYQGK